MSSRSYASFQLLPILRRENCKIELRCDATEEKKSKIELITINYKYFVFC